MRGWLKSMRESAGLSKTALAKEVGAHLSVIGKYEAGIRTPKRKRAKKIAEVLGFDWTRFYEDEDGQQ